MSEERPDASLFIGLHKLAEQNGEGLVPELYARLADRRQLERGMSNVVAFPDASRQVQSDALAEEPAKILCFRRKDPQGYR